MKKAFFIITFLLIFSVAYADRIRVTGGGSGSVGGGGYVNFTNNETANISWPNTFNATAVQVNGVNVVTDLSAYYNATQVLALESLTNYYNKTDSDAKYLIATSNLNASLVNAGTLGAAYYSAIADLRAESKVGTDDGDVAEGNHTHSGMYEPAGVTVSDISDIDTNVVNKTVILGGSGDVTGPWNNLQIVGTGVTSGTFALATVTVDPDGRITDISNGTSSDPITIKEGNVVVGNNNITTVDFGTGFDVAETPAGEVNIVFDFNEFTLDTSLLGGDMFAYYEDVAGDEKKISWTNLQLSIDTVGTIGTGVWNGTVIADAYIASTIARDTELVGANEAYDATNWDNDTSIPEKDDIRDKLETMPQTAGDRITLTGTDLDVDVGPIVNGDTANCTTPDAVFDYAQPLEATLTDIADGTIAENLVNTANPWAADEIVSTVIHNDEMDASSELAAIMDDESGTGLLTFNNAPTLHAPVIRGVGVSNTAFALRVTDSAPTDRIVVLNNGNVGIGTTDPIGKLHIAGTGKVGIGTTNPGSRLTIIASNTTPAENLYIQGSVGGRLIISQSDGGCSSCGVDAAGTTWACIDVTCP